MTRNEAYPGQGNPLPATMGISGYWIFENLFFLTEMPDVPCDDGSTRSLVATSPLRTPCFGFYAARVAQGLGLTTEQLLKVNKRGKLRLSDDGPQPGGKLLRLTFSFAGRSTSVVLEPPTIVGGSA